MATEIDLKTFMDGYKTVEITLDKKKRVFREPKVKDLELSIVEILEKYCLEGDAKEFMKIIQNDLPKSKYQEALDTILGGLGLA